MSIGKIYGSVKHTISKKVNKTLLNLELTKKCVDMTISTKVDRTCAKYKLADKLRFQKKKIFKPLTDMLATYKECKGKGKIKALKEVFKKNGIGSSLGAISGASIGCISAPVPGTAELGAVVGMHIGQGVEKGIRTGTKIGKKIFMLF